MRPRTCYLDVHDGSDDRHARHRANSTQERLLGRASHWRGRSFSGDRRRLARYEGGSTRGRAVARIEDRDLFRQPQGRYSPLARGHANGARRLPARGAEVPALSQAWAERPVKNIPLPPSLWLSRGRDRSTPDKCPAPFRRPAIESTPSSLWPISRRVPSEGLRPSASTSTARFHSYSVDRWRISRPRRP